MSTVITSTRFGNPAEVRAAMAANEAVIRAEALGYSKTAQQQFARIARREASEWEHPQHTALRIVLPQRASLSPTPPGPTAASLPAAGGAFSSEVTP